MSRHVAYAFSLTSTLHAAPEDVWARVGTVDGVNLELAPWLRITAPRDVRRLEDLPLGTPAFRAWVLLLGFVPVDADALTLVAVDPLHGFLERSRTLTAVQWEHRRTLSRHPDGTELSDEVTVQPRIAVTSALHSRAVHATFAHRHRRLRAAFGGRASAASDGQR